MTSVRVYNAVGTAPPTIRVYNVSGVGSAGTTRTIRVYNVSGAGTVLPSLTASKSAYDPGELVTITVTNGNGSGSFAFPAGTPTGTTIIGDVCTFTAQAKVDAYTVTASYSGLAFLTININPAFVLVGDIPGTIWVDR